jgi:hypothetical protein
VRELTGLKMRFTPCDLRRTFNDLAREAKVESLITKSISRHATERMLEHYSTVRPGELRESIGRVLRLVKGATVPSGTAEKWCPPSGAPTSLAVLQDDEVTACPA